MRDPVDGGAPALGPASDPEVRLRALCMALPDAEEREAFGGPTFRVRDRIFALATRRDGVPSVWVKAPHGSQTILVGADPRRFFVPPYLGPKGWVGIRLADAPDWTEIGGLVIRSYRLIAPKRLASRLDGTRPAGDGAP